MPTRHPVMSSCANPAMLFKSFTWMLDPESCHGLLAVYDKIDSFESAHKSNELPAPG